MPKNLTYLMLTPDEKREHIRQKVIEGIQESFPIKSRSKTLDITDMSFDTRDYSPSEQKKAILQGDSLSESVRGTVRMLDSEGKVLDEVKNFTIAKVPWFTPRHTLIIGGNEYSVANQVRPKPGVYTRERANGEVEAQFNTRGASRNFNIVLDPQKGEPQLEYKSAKVPLYPVLRMAGVSHEEISRVWGPRLADKNAATSWGKRAKILTSLYNRVVPPYSQKPGLTPDEMAAEVFGIYAKEGLDSTVTSKTLGKPYDHVTPDSMLTASKKVLRIYNKEEAADDRDHLDFKAMYSVDDFFKERIKLNAREIARKASIKIESAPTLRKALPSGPFTGGLIKFINSSQLVSVPTQTNPVDLIDSSMRVTALGEGGIQIERAITMDARQTHPSQIGALDPFRTPETFRAGVDVRATVGVKKDDDGNIYVPLINARTGKQEHVMVRTVTDEIVAFPNQQLKGQVDALVKGVIRKVPASSVAYQMPHPSMSYGPTTNLIPFIESLQGNRAVMGSKMQTQALSLVDREAPYVQVMGATGRPYERMTADLINPMAPVSGTIAKIDADYVYITPTDPSHIKTAAIRQERGLVKVPYETYFPFAGETHLTHTLNVKPGDAVKSGQQLGDSNFTQNGTLALGKNLSVAYIPYYGANSNDAVVISAGAATKLTSERMYKYIVPLDSDVMLNKSKHQAYYGHNYTRAQYDMLTPDGLIQKGSKVNMGDPLFIGLRKTEMTSDDVLLGKLHRSLVKPYREQSQLWDHPHAGVVMDVVKMPKRIAITVRTQEPMGIGDKLSGRYGNKGVVADIIPDADMVRDESGKPIDILLTSAGVVSRTNPAQIIETAIGKVVEKTGKPIIVDNLTGRDNVQWAKALLKEHGIKDKETVFDPRAGKSIPGVFVGRQYILKLMKSTDKNYSARSIGGYDVNEQPTHGGVEGAKKLGKMEFDALVAHNARNVLRESSTIKSQKNDEYWRAVQLGYPTPPPQASFAYNKFNDMLVGAGVNVERRGNIITAAPLTDADILERSSGEIKEPLLIKSKNFSPEIGGLFDPAVTGGLNGTKWGHIKLTEPVVSPTFLEPVRRLLGMSTTGLQKTVAEKGGEHVRKLLRDINLDTLEADIRKGSDAKSGTALDDDVKRLKYIRALRARNLTPDNAYMISNVPVVPPVIRPIIPGRGNQEIMYGDINPLYRDLLYTNNQFRDVKKSKLLPAEEVKLRASLQEAVGAVYGVNEPITAKSRARGHKGFLTYISGVTSPKEGYFHSKLLSREQDVAGRGTAVPDNTLGMDEVGIPEDMLWTMYDKFIVQGLVQSGYSAFDAAAMVKSKHPAAKAILERERQGRPVMLNRAPTLHRFSIVGAYPKPVPGKTLRVSPFIESGTNLDYDGDSADSDLEFVIDACYTRLHIGECPHNKESVIVKGNTEVYTVPEGIKVFGYSDTQQRVVLCDVTHFSVHHDLEMVTVTTDTGRTVRVSRDHSMFGMDPETGQLQRFRAEDGLGWGIVRPRQLFCADSLHGVKLHNTDLCGEVSLTADTGWLIGSWAGDGWVTENSGVPAYVGLANVSPEVQENFRRIVGDIAPGVSIRKYQNRHEYRGSTCYSEKLHANSRPFARLFTELTQGNSGAATKQLPSYFVQGSRDFLLGLFAGLLDTDGTVSLVKAVKKSRAQYMVFYFTKSEALADHIATVALMLGVRSNYYWYTRKRDGERYCQVTFSTPDVARIAAEIPCVHVRKRELLDALSHETFNMAVGPNARHDAVPVPNGWLAHIRQLIGRIAKKQPADPQGAERWLEDKCWCVTLSQSAKSRRISRIQLERFITRFGVEAVASGAPEGWLELVRNGDILWDFVKSVEQIDGRRTAWDLTVPDGCTFMTSNQLVVYDTLMVHVPVGAKAVEEVKQMTMSHLLRGDKNRSDLLAFPQHEAIMGIAHASVAADSKHKPMVFESEAAAQKAYLDGSLTLGTQVKIKNK